MEISKREKLKEIIKLLMDLLDEDKQSIPSVEMVIDGIECDRYGIPIDCEPETRKRIMKEELQEIKGDKFFFKKNDFDKYINSLPKYYKRTKKNKYEEHIRDYLVKNRSASLRDIVRGCQDQGLKFEAHDPGSAFYKSLRNLIKSGKITKSNKIYFWNYE